MKAARVRHFGPPDVIRIEDVDIPRPGANEVLVRVAVASVGPWDSWIRAGKSVLPQPLPLTLGSDLSGTVVALGDGVTDLAVGDPVFGVTNKRFTNAYAELALASAAMIAKRPAGVEHALAASAPVVSVTALQMLFDHAKVVAGQRVLVQGAGGNVGAYAVQLAKHAGAHVTGTGVTRDLDYISSLGADAVVDTGTTRFEDVVAPMDAVIDTVGGDLQARSLGVLVPGGTLVSAVSQPDQAEAARRGVRASFILVDVHREALTRIGALLAARKIEGRLGPTLPLGEARRAHEMLDGLVPRPPGKILLAVG
jgi:NADPH:quinone reductase-like Zn-dependent oxidoreductase